MSPSLAPDFKETVRSRTNLVELVSESIALKAKGGNDYVGLCPFHQDHNPSFHVYADRQTYRCWVCQEGGDCFSFVMKYEAIDFRQALESLARRAGLEMPKQERGLFAGRRDADGSAGGEIKGEINKNELYEIAAWAEQQYHDCLNSPAGDEARNYLLERGFTAETIAKYRLGYHPNDWHWLENKARGRFSTQQLLLARVIVEKEKDGRVFQHDCFLDRVMFPVRDERSRTVGFAGRVLPGRDGGGGKYINSLDGPLFQKNKLVFALDVARDAIRKSETAIVVEGHADCIMAHQHGLSNVVATMGTALTDSQVQILKRFAKRVVLLFDADAAGRLAAEKVLGKFLAVDVDLRVLTLPEGSKDPDEYLRQHGVESFRAIMAQAPDVLNYKLACAIDKYGLDTNPTAGARDLVLGEMLDLMAESRELAGSPREDGMRSRLAQRLLIPEETIFKQLQQRRQKNGRHPGNRPGAAARPVQTSIAPGNIPRAGRDIAGRPAPAPVPENAEEKPVRDLNDFLKGARSKSELEECDLLEILFTAPEWADDIRLHVSVSDFQNEHLRDLAQVCFDVAEQGKSPSCDLVLAALEDPELKRLAVAIDGMARDKGIRELLHHRPNPAERLHLPGQPGEFAFVEGMHGADQEGRPARPVFLQLAIDHMMWRRQESSRQQSSLQMAQFSTKFDPHARQLMERLTEYHLQRAAKKPPAAT